MNEAASGSVTARRFGGLFGIGGGVAGLSTVVPTLMQPIGALPKILSVLAASLYTFGVVSGVRLMENRPGASGQFQLFLWLQVPIIQTGVLSYFFAALASVSILWHGAGSFETVIGVLSGWTLSLFATPAKTGIGINVLPIFLAIGYRMLCKVRISTG